MLPSYTQDIHARNRRKTTPRDTAQKLSELSRVRGMLSNKSRRPFFETLRITLANSVAQTLQMLHLMSVDKTPRMCSNYGHVITRGYWGKGLPKCEECGATIKDPNQLRKAMPQPVR